MAACWIVKEFPKQNKKFIVCSNCDATIDCNQGWVDENEYDFCPYCGELMNIKHVSNLAEAIRNVRLKRKMTQKQLGLALGFEDKTADIRISQYESGDRTPKRKLLEKIESILNCKFNSVNYVEYTVYGESKPGLVVGGSSFEECIEKYNSAKEKENLSGRVIDNALGHIQMHKITKTSYASATLDDISYDKKYVVVDVAYVVSKNGAVDDAEPIYEAPATMDNINIANLILSKIKELYGMEVVFCES